MPCKVSSLLQEYLVNREVVLSFRMTYTAEVWWHALRACRTSPEFSGTLCARNVHHQSFVVQSAREPYTAGVLRYLLRACRTSSKFCGTLCARAVHRQSFAVFLAREEYPVGVFWGSIFRRRENLLVVFCCFFRRREKFYVINIVFAHPHFRFVVCILLNYP